MQVSVLHACVQTCLCLLMLTWAYWPRWCPDGRSSGTQSPGGCCRHSAWSSLSVLGHCHWPPLPAVSSPEDPNLVQDKEPLSNCDPYTTSTPAKPNQLSVASASTLFHFYCFSKHKTDGDATRLLCTEFAGEDMKKLINCSLQIPLSFSQNSSFLIFRNSKNLLETKWAAFMW